MSQLIMTGGGQSFALNVVDFNSYMMEQENSAQCKMLQVHFPVRMAQPGVSFDIVFIGDADYQAFQVFVRRQQLLAVSNSQLITLFWPERNINNWTGVISKIEGGDMRWNYAPHTHIEFDLVDSLLSQRTTFSSISAYWTAIYGINMPGGVLNEPSLTANQSLENSGLSFTNSGNTITTPGGSTLNVPTGQINLANPVLSGS